MRVVWLAVAALATAIMVRGSPDWASAALRDSEGLPVRVAAVVSLAAAALAALSFVAVATVVAWRRPRGRFALVASTALLLRAPGFVVDLPALAAADPGWAVPVSLLRASDGIAALAFLYVFPDGRFTPRWTLLLWGFWSGWVLGTLAVPSLDPVLETRAPWAVAALIVFALSGLAAQVERHRRHIESRQRGQTKWIVYGLSVYVAVFVVSEALPVFVTSAVAGPLHLALSLANDLAAIVVSATIAIAVLRQHLFDIDLLISRTVVYFTATAIVAAAFGALSASAQLLLRQVWGQGSDGLTIVIALVVGATFAPVKAYVQWRLDRGLRRRADAPVAG